MYKQAIHGPFFIHMKEFWKKGKYVTRNREEKIIASFREKQNGNLEVILV